MATRRKTPTGGVGSNQYQTRGTSRRRPRTARVDTFASNTPTDDAPAADEWANTWLASEDTTRPWRGPHPQRVPRPAGLDGDGPEAQIRHLIWTYPSVVPSRGEALVTLFGSYGTGFEWNHDTGVLEPVMREPEHRFEDGLLCEDPAILRPLIEADKRKPRDPALEAALDRILKAEGIKPSPGPEPGSADWERSVADRVQFEIDGAREDNAEVLAVRTRFEEAVAELRPMSEYALERAPGDLAYIAQRGLRPPREKMRSDWAAAYDEAVTYLRSQGIDA